MTKKSTIRISTEATTTACVVERAHSLRAAAGRHSVVAAHGRDDKPEEHRLYQSGKYIPTNQCLPC